MSFGIMKVKLSYMYLAGFFVLSLLIGAAYLYATSSPYRISSQEAKRRIGADEIDLILDVRTLVERESLGFYPGSVHIQSADLDKAMHVRYPNKNIRILAYCNTGHRARAATDKLHALGYKNAVFISSSYKTME
jgi:rhodanese-related sulfurtransferase